MVRLLVALICAVVIVAVTGALRQQKASAAVGADSVLSGFDLREDAASQKNLPLALREVSGLAVSADGRAFAHADERGVIVELDACEGTVTKAFSLGSPPVRADFEGVAIAGERFFLLTSTGQLYETREGARNATVPFTVIETGFGKTCELEGLAWNAADGTLVTGCKQSGAFSLRGRLAFLRWSVDRAAPAVPPSLTMPLADVIRGTGTKGFRPSAVERDTRTGNYLAIAGPERAIVEFTAAGTVVASRPLSRKLHQQPEGLALLGDSVLVIADEGADRPGTLTCYRRAR